MDKLVQPGRRVCLAFHHLNSDCCLVWIISSQTTEQFTSFPPPSIFYTLVPPNLHLSPSCHCLSPHDCIYLGHSSSFFPLSCCFFFFFSPRSSLHSVFVKIENSQSEPSVCAIQSTVMQRQGCRIGVGGGVFEGFRRCVTIFSVFIYSKLSS